MIVRIAGMGQFELPDGLALELNAIDEELEAAVASGGDNLSGYLEAMHRLVQANGIPLGDEALEASDFVLPPADVTLEDLLEMLGDEGLVPG